MLFGALPLAPSKKIYEVLLALLDTMASSLVRAESISKTASATVDAAHVPRDTNTRGRIKCPASVIKIVAHVEVVVGDVVAWVCYHVVCIIIFCCMREPLRHKREHVGLALSHQSLLVQH